MHSSGTKLSDLLGLTTLVLLILWFCQDLILSDQVPFFRDLGNYFYPLRYSLSQSYKSAELPLWDRHFAMGFPFLAAFQSGAFYPPHLLLMVLPFFPAIRLLFVFHFLVAATGAYMLVRHWKYPCFLSIVGALLFTLGGTVVSLTNLLNHFQTAIWLPWLILSWEKTLHVTSWRNFLVFVAVAAVQLLAGSPELFVMSMALVLGDGLRIRLLEPRISYKSIVGVFIAGNLIVVALTMAQLLPTAELIFQSRRQQPIHPQEALSWSLAPLSLLNLFFLDKEIDLNLFSGTRLFFAREATFFVSYYLGAFSLFGICLWFSYSSTREKVCFGALLSLSIALALGSYTPIYPLLFTYVPIVSSLRFPEKFFFLTYGLLLFAAIRGIGSLFVDQERTSTRPYIILTAVCFIWLAVYVFLRFNTDLLATFISAKSAIPAFSAAHAKAIASVLANMERQVALSFGFIVLLIMNRTKMIRPSLCGILIVLSVFVDLVWAHRSFLLPLHPDFIYESPRIIREPDVAPNRLFYYPPIRNLHPSFVSVLGRPTFKEAQALSFHILLPNAGVLYGFEYMQEMDALGRQPYSDFLFFANELDFSRQLQLMRTFNIRYLVTLRPLHENGITLIREFPQYFSWLYKIDRTVPRVYVVNKSMVEENSERLLQLLASPDFNPMQEVVLERSAGITPQGELVATAKIVRYEHQSVTIHASLNGSGMLVLADSYYPGWNAYVDGRQEKIHRANLFFRAVPLSAGTHTVEFRYEPRSFAIGSAVSIITLLTILVVSMFVHLRRRRGTSPPRLVKLEYCHQRNTGKLFREVNRCAAAHEVTVTGP